MTWMQTRDGHDVDLVRPDLSAVTIEEVAHALSLINRFTGHTLSSKRGYSVAQHSVGVSLHLPPQYAFAGLMHDAHEAFMGDISTPVKRALFMLGGAEALAALDHGLASAVEKRWNIPSDPEMWAAVKGADLRALVTERRDFMHECPRTWGFPSGTRGWPEKLKMLRPHDAAQVFLYRFHQLARSR